MTKRTKDTVTLYELTRLQGRYWWTGTVEVEKDDLPLYDEDKEALYVQSKAKAQELSGTEIGKGRGQ